MSNQIQTSTVKFMVHNKMKAKLKATAALNNVTLGTLFMNAVLEKYPYLTSEMEKEKSKHLEGELYEEKEI